MSHVEKSLLTQLTTGICKTTLAVFVQRKGVLFFSTGNHGDPKQSDQSTVRPSLLTQDVDSTFDFGSNSENSNSDDSANDFIHVGHEDMPENSVDEGRDFEMPFSDYDSSSDGEEVWEISESESDETEPGIANNHTVQNLLFDIAMFLSFHIFYKLTERATIALLVFLKTLFNFIGGITSTRLLLELANALPKSLYGIRKYFKRQNDFTEYVVCPKCSQLYILSECIMKNQHGNDESRRCDHVEFPNHPFPHKRNKCNTVLMKQVKVNGRYKLVPRKVFLYRSIIHSLIDMAKRPDFLTKCEHWRCRPNFQEELLDVYEGNVWKCLMHIDGRPFLALPNNLCLAMNVDWFNPYEDSPYSVGAIYLVVLNLPRAERFKIGNVILACIIPGPNEPSGNINTFLSPMIVI